MAQAYASALALYWHTLCGALRARRDGDEGMATIEVLVVTAGLVIVAGLMVTILTNSATKESQSLP